MSYKKESITIAILILTITISYSAIVLKQALQNEIILEDNPSNNSKYPHVKLLDNDYIVVAWFDITSLKIAFQIFDPVGRKQGTNITIGPANSLYRRYIESLPNNKFIICYSYSGNISGQIYNYEGTTSGSPFIINNDMPGFYESLEIARLSNGNFVVLWNADMYSLYYKVFSANGSPLTASILILESSTDKSSPAIKAKDNNSFIICWREIGLINDSLLCRFFDTNGAIGLTNITIDTFPTFPRDQRFLSMERLSDGNYVIAYNMIVSNYNNFFIVIDSNSGVIVPRTSVNAPTGYNNESPEVSSLSNDGFVIAFDGKACLSCKYNSYIQKYDSSYNAIGANTQVNIDTLSDHYDASVVGLKNNGFIVAWRSLNQYSPSSSNDIYMNMWYGDEIDIICKDISIFLKTEAITTIDFGSNISDDYIDGVNIVFDSPASYGTFILSTGTIAVANTPYPYNLLSYQSDVNSGSYNINYYTIDYFSNKSSTCTINISVCYSTCEACNQVGEDVDHMCLTCKSGFFKLGTNCFKSCPLNFKGNGYYLDETTNTCIKCNSPCNECSRNSTCINCISGYYLAEYLTNNNCINQCPVGYYPLENICKQCNPLCTSCLSNSTDCMSCIPGAYYLKDKNQCLTKCAEGYIPDGQNNCITCKSLNQYFSADQCVVQCPTNEYPDINNTCGTCKSILYNNICYETCPDGTYLDSINNYCFACSDMNQIDFNNSCVDKCPDGYYIENDKCQACSAESMFLYNNECIKDCPVGTIPNTKLFICTNIGISIKSNYFV
jgi:hypothetical protein